MSFATLSSAWFTTRHPDELLLIVLAAMLGMLTMWCLITWLISRVNLHLAILVAPPLMRAALITSVVVGVGTTAHAQESANGTVNGLILPDRPVSTSTSDDTALFIDSALPLSDLAQASTMPDLDLRLSTAPRTPTDDNTELEQSTHHVKAGDSLWLIASQHLTPNASNAEIAQAVTRWHESNHAVIGDNPHLIHPGQELKEPAQ